MITVGMDGVKDAVEVLQEIVTPWRRKNAETKAKLDVDFRQAEIKRVKAETLITNAKVARERVGISKDKSESELILSQAKKTEAEATLLLAQAQQILAEIDKERALMKIQQMELAMKLIDKYAPQLEDAKKMESVAKLLPILEQFISSNLELRDNTAK